MIAIDLGQSGARAFINGETVDIPRGKLAGESIIQALTEVAKILTPSSAQTVALSLTGFFGEVGDPYPFHALSQSLWGATSTVVIDDGLASYFGALSGKQGVALTLGGGVVAVGGCNDIFSHADGLGSIFGDEGSGYWIGTRGITRALATADGRDHEIELAQYLSMEIKAFEELEVKNSSQAVVLAISAASKVLQAADAGNACAESIRIEGARRLGATVVGAWEKAGGTLEASPVVAVTGGLSKNRGYVNRIIDEVHRSIPKASLIEPIGNNLDGAIWIAENHGEDIKLLMRWARG